MQQFKTESKKLLDLVINSIYTNKEVFLRELISNASDSLDKVILKAAAEGDEIDRSTLAIDLDYDEEARTITVSDNGIGMSAQELEENLGTIAHSSSFEMKHSDEDLSDQDVDIIGQFGVGFYSSFMVADKVTVISRAYGSEEANIWESDGLEGFTIRPGQRSNHGTDVILHIRPNSNGFDYTKFMSHPSMSELVKRHSNYIRYPIYLEVTGQREVEKPEGVRYWEPTFEDFTERRILNSMVPIWAKPRSEVSVEDYDEYYKTEFDDPKPPLRIISMHARGSRSCDVLLFIPAEPPADLYTAEFKKGLELYSSGVMIQERCEDLLPEYFGFVRGVVDSPDISLNLSRNTMQEDQFLKAIAQQIDKRLKAELEAMRDNERDEYINFFINFGRMFKFAVYATFGTLNEQLEDFLMFFTAKKDEPVTLREYFNDMPANQPYLFFASGVDAGRLEASPSVKAVTDKGFDVLLCSESIDEFCMMTLREYSGKLIKNVTSDDLGLDDDLTVALTNNVNRENAGLFAAMRKALPSDVIEVTATSKLSTIPACIAAKGPISLGMEKYFASMPEEMGGRPKIQHALELNPGHPVFEKLKTAYNQKDDETVAQYATILYGQAMLTEGLPLSNFAAYSKAVYDLMS